jgi:hypothetical protein
MVVIPQRYDGDCALAALACLTGVAYEDVYVEAVKVVDRPRIYWKTHGLYNYEVQAIAKRLHWRLRPTTDFDLQVDEGILRVFWLDPDKARDYDGGHFVAASGGVLGCPTNCNFGPWRDWLTTNHADPKTLLRVTRRP